MWYVRNGIECQSYSNYFIILIKDCFWLNLLSFVKIYRNAKKEYVGYTRLNQKQLDNYAKGKSFTVKPVHHENEDDTVVKLHFKAKKNLSKLDRNLKNGKGVRIHPDELEDMQMHTGNGFFDSMKGVMNSKLMSRQ